MARLPGSRDDNGAETSLLDVVDNVLNHGLVLQGDLMLGLAGVDLVYARLSLLLSAADRLGGAAGQSRTASSARRQLKSPRRGR